MKDTARERSSDGHRQFGLQGAASGPNKNPNAQLL
jgi:hypothetical protein